MTSVPGTRATAGVVLLVCLLLAACPGPPPPEPAARRTPAPTSTAEVEPRGHIRVAYSDVPSRWVVPRGDDPAAIDLSALWGLPLYRLDPHGQLRPALVTDATVTDRDGGGMSVRLRLRRGAWSDGRPVVAADVVATLRRLAAGPRSARLRPLVDVRARGRHEVELVFDRSYARWPYLLADTGGVLPAHVLRDSGLAAYRDGVPVAGGWFRLLRQEPGRSATFVSHRQGPLGPPGLERITVLFAPDFGTALGLLRSGEVEVTAGHLALNPVGRARRIDGITAAAPLGGTWVGLDWRRGGPLGQEEDADERRALTAAVDAGELVEGLLEGIGEVATSPVPGVRAPRPGAAGTLPPEEVVLVAPGWHEATRLTLRALRGDVARAGGALRVAHRDTPGFVAAARGERDGALRVHRDTPRPSLVPYLGAGRLALAADATATADDDRALAAVARRGLVSPLYRIGVAHAWRAARVEVDPSSWPGVGLWNVGEWRRLERSP